MLNWLRDIPHRRCFPEASRVAVRMRHSFALACLTLLFSGVPAAVSRPGTQVDTPVVTAAATAPLPGVAQHAPTWFDTFESRLEVLALTQTLNAEILAGSSATLS